MDRWTTVSSGWTWPNPSVAEAGVEVGIVVELLFGFVGERSDLLITELPPIASKVCTPPSTSATPILRWGCCCCPSTWSRATCWGNRARVGYLLKERVTGTCEFVDAVRKVAAGHCVVDPEVAAVMMRRRRIADPYDRLAEREREVLALMAQGRSNAAVCAQLHLSAKTVESHVRSIFQRLDLLPAPDDHRRVLAVLTFLQARGSLEGTEDPRYAPGVGR